VRWLGLTLLLGAALAQPIDPLVRPQETPGQLRYSLGVRYAPLQVSGVGEEAERGLFVFTQVQHGLQLLGELDLVLDPGWKAFLSFSPEVRYLQTERRFALATERRSGLELSWGGVLGVEARLGGWGELEPRLSLALVYPWALRYGLVLSLIRDPVVLAAQVSLSDPLNEEATQLSLALATGFVANERVSLQLESGLGFTLGDLIVPEANLRLRTINTLEVRSEQQLAALLALRLAGQTLRLEWGLELGGILR